MVEFEIAPAAISNMGDTPSSWRDLVGTKSLDEYLTEQYGDKTKFRLTRRAYPKGTRTVWGTVAVKCFVLEGSCRYSLGDVRFDIAAGEYCELPQGQYDFEVVGDSECVFFTAYLIPPPPQRNS